MKHKPRYSLKYLSIRVPWHDNARNGAVCSNRRTLLVTANKAQEIQNGSIRVAVSVKEVDQIITQHFKK